MRKIAFLAFFIPLFLSAQKNIESKSAKELIREGVRLYDQKSYYDAIEKFKQVSVNDTNYSTAQYETALTYLKLEEYFFAQKILKELIGLEVSYPNRAKAYVLLGQAYDGDKKLDEALKAYEEGLKMYPKSQALYFARATTYAKFDKHQEALEDFKRSAMCNIGHPGTHLRLGMIAAREGQYTQSLLSLMTFLLLEPYSDRSASVVSLIEQIADGSYAADPKNIVLSAEGDKFDDLNLFITNKVALQDKYKAKFTIPTSYAKQMHLVLSTIKYEKSDEGFWNQTYMPFYEDIFKSNLLDGMVLFTLKSVESKDIQKKLASKSKISENFFNQGGAKWRDHISKQYIEFEGKKQHVLTVYQGGGLQAVGKISEDNKMYGKYYYYHKDGGLSLVANFDEKGEKSGVWTWYDFFTHKVIEETTFKDNEMNGVTKIYFPSGELKQTRKYVDGQVQDTMYNYYRGGGIQEKVAMKDGLRNGISIGYHPNGQVEFTAIYEKGEPNGKYVLNHLNNQKFRELNLVKGVVVGNRKTYYPDGQLENEYEFNAEGVADGPYTKYFQNGKIEEKGNLKNGNSVGEIKEYYSNGNLFSTSVFDESGKENGSIIYYDLDGKKYEEFVYKKGSLESITLFDKAGKQVEKIERSGKKLNYKSHFQTGRVYAEGVILNDKKTGLWKYYDQYGNIKYTEKYKEGELTDTTFGYHPNGKLYYQIVYENGKRNGLYLEYNQLGTLVEEGMYKEDERSNDWYVYDSNGDVEYESCYKNGERHGLQKSYAVNGVLSQYDIYDNGEIIASVFLDTAENVIQRFGVFHGEVVLRDANNTYDHFKASYKNGASDGKTTWYSVTGKVLVEGNFINNKRDGLWTWYHDNGKVRKTIMYKLGEVHGSIKEYAENGQLTYDANYENGNAQGIISHYYENGKLEYQSNYMDDERHGKMVSYALDGSVQQYRYYEKGVLISYSYLDKNGKEVEPIVIGPGKSQIVTYYQSGIKSVEQTRINGEIDGTYTEYHANGKIAVQSNYIYGDRDGMSTEYYENGVKKSEKTYKLGEKHGVHTEYFPSGKVKSTQEYMFDKADGYYKVYNEAGKLVQTSYYFNDEIISFKNN